jgi:hypothetical protein
MKAAARADPLREVKSQKVVDPSLAPSPETAPREGGAGDAPVDSMAEIELLHRQKLEVLSRDYREKVAELAPKALGVLSDQMFDPSLTPGQRAGRAHAVLDRFKELVELDLKVLLIRAKVGMLEGRGGSSFNPAGRVDWTRVPREKMVEICRQKTPEARKLLT